MRTRQGSMKLLASHRPPGSLQGHRSFWMHGAVTLIERLVYEHKQQLAIFVASVPPSGHRLAIRALR